MDRDLNSLPRTTIGHPDRRRLADSLHAGLVQQVTALSLAVDNALLHHADGDTAAVGRALRRVRAHADEAIADCRAVIDGLRNHAGA